MLSGIRWDILLLNIKIIKLVHLISADKEFVFLPCSSKMRDIGEKQFRIVASGDTKPNSWTLLDFGKSLFSVLCFIY